MTPLQAGMTMTTEVEMIVDEKNAKESGAEAAHLVTDFILGYVEEIAS